MSVCEKDCVFKDYNYTAKKVICECLIKIKFPLISEIEINKNLLINNMNISNIINLEIIECCDVLFSKIGLIKNIGNYILIIIILINTKLLIVFIIKGFKSIENQIEYIINIKNIIKNKDCDKKKKKLPKKNIIINNISNFETTTDNSNFKFKNIKFSDNIDLSNLNNDIVKYNDNELNNLSYKEAIINDKRNYINYYFSLLKIKHILLFTFFNNNDYNSKIIKIYLFIFTFALYFAINSFFFNDSTIHKIYENKGKFNFIHLLSIAFYSSIISSIINIIIKYLSLSENNVLEIKHEKNDIIKKSEKNIKMFKNKIYNILYFNFYTSYFILVLYFLLLCDIYKYSNSFNNSCIN